MYQEKHYNKGDTSQDDNLRRPEEECKDSNEEDWRITLDDEEQCDGFDVPLSDNELELPTNRHRIAFSPCWSNPKYL